MSKDFNSYIIRLGTVTVSFAIVANFIPALWLWFRYGAVPTFSEIMTMWGMVAAAFGMSWLVQNLSYYGGLGSVGTYVSWVSGTAADIRMPGITMAHKVTGTEANTPEGDAIGAMAVSTTVFVSVTLISIFSVIGSAIIPLFPESVKTSFNYIQPALFASVYASMFPKDLLAAVLTLLGSYAAFVYLPPLGLPKVYMMLVTVGLGMIAGYLGFRLKNKLAL